MKTLLWLLYVLVVGSRLAGAVVPLSGEWRIALDAADVGESGKWAEARLPGGGAIPLPGTTDLARAGEAVSTVEMGRLNRAFRFVGAAWYQREIEIPKEWKGSAVELFLERVLWQSKVWVDGRAAGVADSLHTPHFHSLGVLEPGKHTLTVRIDNRMIHPIGIWGHPYTEETQSIWNGMVGRIELRRRPAASLGLLRVFADAENRRVRVEAEVEGGAGLLEVTVRELPGRRVVVRGKVQAQGGGSRVEVNVQVPSAVKLWGEFSPNLYLTEAVLTDSTSKTRDQKAAQFGFRRVEREGRQIRVNGQRVFLRGNLENAQFPLTGAPPTDVGSWRKLLQKYKDHGLNHVRFHSWSPPEAAFQAADELGIYIQAEVLWIDKWMGEVHPVLGRTPGAPKGIGIGDRTIDAFVRAEMRRVLDIYGNHPSFVLFCIGNELGSANFEEIGRWLAEEKARDPRRLYSGSTARQISTADDYTVTHALPGIGRTRGHVESGTDWDYQKTYERSPVPVIAHEIGQWPVYPVWAELAKYTGVLRPTNLEKLRELARRNGLEEQDKALGMASGASSLLMYKYEAESFLRTPDCSGVQLLSMQDYPGQGEALVGWLDAFYESKGLVRPEQVRRWYGPVVPLARLKKFVWSNQEDFTAGVEIAHYGAHELRNVQAVWTLAGEDDAVVAQGSLPAVNVPRGGVTALGEITALLRPVQKAARLTLTVAVAGTEYGNEWPVFVFPGSTESESEPEPEAGQAVVVTADLESAQAELARGGRVLLLANKLGGEEAETRAAWQPLYWSLTFMPRQRRQTLGAIVRADHPALRGFPTQGFLDWQWRGLAQGARGFDLTVLPAAYRPIVQPVSDFHESRKLGSLFELRVGEQGKLLVCGYDLGQPGKRSLEARQLLRSLLEYARSDEFHPAQEVQAVELAGIFAGRR